MNVFSKRAKTILIIVIIVAVILMSLSVILPVALYEKKAIIILPGLIANGLENQKTGEPVWAPFETNYTLTDFFDPTVSTKMIANLALEATKGGENSILNKILRGDEDGIIKMLAVDEDGMPINKDIVPMTMASNNSQKYGALQNCRDLYLRLNEKYGAEYEVSVFNYDWRVDNRISAEGLEKYINDNEYEKVVIVSHSMGNLVATNYFARSAENRKKVLGHISLAGPYYGSMMALSVLEDLDGLMASIVDMVPDFISDAVNDIAYEQFLPLAKNLTTLVQLLPTIELAATEQVDGAFLTVDGQKINTYEQLLAFYKSRSWAKTASGNMRKAVNELEDYWDSFYVTENGKKVHASSLVNTIYCAGVDYKTENIVAIVDGKYHSSEYSSLGDGTVQLYSAILGLDDKSENVFAMPNTDHFGCGCKFDGELESKVYAFINSL